MLVGHDFVNVVHATPSPRAASKKAPTCGPVSIQIYSGSSLEKIYTMAASATPGNWSEVMHSHSNNRTDPANYIRPIPKSNCQIDQVTILIVLWEVCVAARSEQIQSLDLRQNTYGVRYATYDLLEIRIGNLSNPRQAPNRSEKQRDGRNERTDLTVSGSSPALGYCFTGVSVKVVFSFATLDILPPKTIQLAAAPAKVVLISCVSARHNHHFL
jgi:hypothetical protein